MLPSIPRIRTYTVTDSKNNIIRTVDHRYWTHGICQLNIRNFSDSDQTAISVDVNSDFNISILVIPDFNKPRRFNIESLALSLSSQNFDDAYEAEHYARNIKQASEAIRSFTSTLHVLDILDTDEAINNEKPPFDDKTLKKAILWFAESSEFSDLQKDVIVRTLNPETDEDLELLKQRHHEAQHVQTARPDETLDLLDKSYDRAVAYMLEYLEEN